MTASRVGPRQLHSVGSTRGRCCWLEETQSSGPDEASCVPGHRFSLYLLLLDYRISFRIRVMMLKSQTMHTLEGLVMASSMTMSRIQVCILGLQKQDDADSNQPQHPQVVSLDLLEVAATTSSIGW